MLLEIVCNQNLNLFFYIVKNILNLIMIIVPILLIVFGTVSFVKLVKNPEEKNGIKKIINQFLGAIIVFFVPMLVNVVMGMLGEGNDISRCWIEAKKSKKATYIPIDKEKKKKITPSAKEYEPGSEGKYLDFSCTSSSVHSQFSCDTLKIVEKHLYDLYATNFYEKINSYGGFNSYTKSVGGIFEEYYGKKMPHETEEDFQRAAEYVLGWMYMYGWDYKNGFEANEGEHLRWGGRGKPYTKDAFYYYGGWERKYVPDYTPYSSEFWRYGTDFDHVISGKNGGVGAMSSECGDLEYFIYNKLNIVKEKEIAKITRLKDLKVGDGIYYLNRSIHAAHNAIIGEVYDDHIVIYDGAFMIESSTQNYKRNLYFPKVDSAAADLDAIQSVVGFKTTEWFGRRFYNFS